MINRTVCQTLNIKRNPNVKMSLVLWLWSLWLTLLCKTALPNKHKGYNGYVVHHFLMTLVTLYSTVPQSEKQFRVIEQSLFYSNIQTEKSMLSLAPGVLLWTVTVNLHGYCFPNSNKTYMMPTLTPSTLDRSTTGQESIQCTESIGTTQK